MVTPNKRLLELRDQAKVKADQDLFDTFAATPHRCSRQVNTECSHRAPGCPAPHASLRVNQHQTSLWNGAVASGLRPKVAPRNAKGCVDCGSCLHGCASGSKRSTHVRRG